MTNRKREKLFYKFIKIFSPVHSPSKMAIKAQRKGIKKGLRDVKKWEKKNRSAINAFHEELKQKGIEIQGVIYDETHI